MTPLENTAAPAPVEEDTDAGAADGGASLDAGSSIVPDWEDRRD